jgi:hypothetical protein
MPSGQLQTGIESRHLLQLLEHTLVQCGIDKKRGREEPNGKQAFRVLGACSLIGGLDEDKS